MHGTTNVRRPTLRRVASSAAAVLSFALARAAAAVETGLDETAVVAFGNTTKVDLAVTVGRIISSLLGFVGIIFLVLTIYAGFLWMTASGNEENVTKAKNILKSSIIGMIIVFASYAIANFVVNAVLKGTTGP